ncbi:hypothetical protein PYCCODRAFT_1048895 [Trametes coccinea BRFM310]|uniref:Uncharacterized protein n=1 Tax=Trametes coccinea (strain BRFM310) TaxID=1353009 RepID=A0A1Y2IBZ9_TRAC3|nr:hypothetical protein PYCCODRAFT_1048895 [Trametes coccinea BRFM310]
MPLRPPPDALRVVGRQVTPGDSARCGVMQYGSRAGMNCEAPGSGTRRARGAAGRAYDAAGVPRRSDGMRAVARKKGGSADGMGWEGAGPIHVGISSLGISDVFELLVRHVHVSSAGPSACLLEDKAERASSTALLAGPVGLGEQIIEERGRVLSLVAPLPDNHLVVLSNSML